MRACATGVQIRILSLALVAAIALSPATADAQSTKRWIYGLAGGLLVGGATYLLMTSLNAGENNSGCSSTGCVTAVGSVLGFGVGYAIGNDMDKKNARRMAAGASLDYEYQNFPLGMVPDRMTSFPGGAAVVGISGAKIVMRDGTTVSRGLGVRGIEDVAVIQSSRLLILSTPSSLIAFPVQDEDAQGQVIDERGGGSMESLQGQLAVAGRDSLRMLDVSGQGDDLSVATVAGFETFEYVADIAYSEFSGLTWVLTEEVLSAYDKDLNQVSEIALPAPGRTVRVSGSRLAVAAGTNGAFVYDVSSPTAPRVVKTFSGVRFSYSADLDGNLLYVAAGNEGVAVVDITSSSEEAVGVARGVRFASDVVVAGTSEVWILDREGRQIQIAEIQVVDPTTSDDASNGSE